MTTKEVRDKLAERGKSLGLYSQTVRIEKNPILQNKVAQGYCAGASLDWLRLVLHNGNGSAMPGDSMAAAAFLMQTTPRRNAFYDSRKAQLRQARAAKTTQLNDAIQQVNEKAQEILNKKLATPGMTQAQYDQLVEKVEESIEKAVAKLQLEHQATMSRFDAASSTDALFRQFWLEFAKTLDGTTGQAQYSKLKIAGSSPNSVYGPPNGLVKAIDAVTSHRGFLPGSGALVGVFPTGAGTGHGVAIHRLNTGKYQFFDPNFGVFEFDYKNLLWAFVFIFLKAYPAMSDGTPDAGDYQDASGMVRAEFVIYLGPGLPVPGVNNLRAGLPV